jgi:hypothetical protein
MKKIVVLLLVCVLILGGKIVFSNSITSITAQINPAINYTLDGEKFVPRDMDGSVMDTIIYNGRSYVPLRAIAEAMDIAVDWEGSTSTIILGEKEGKGQSLFSMNFRKFGGFVDIQKTTESKFLTFTAGAQNVAFEEGIFIENTSSSTSASASITFNTNKKYQKLYLKTFIHKDTDSNVEIEIFGDNDVRIYSDTIAFGDINELVVDVGGQDSIEIVFKINSGDTFSIVDSYFR